MSDARVFDVRDHGTQDDKRKAVPKTCLQSYTGNPKEDIVSIGRQNRDLWTAAIQPEARK